MSWGNNNFDSNDNQSTEMDDHMKKVAWGCVGLGALGVGGFLAMRYHVAEPNQFIAKTGPFVRGISISKQTMQWPFQRVRVYDVNPSTYNFNLKCMSKQMIEMHLPIAFAMQPIIPTKNEELAGNFARRMLNIDQDDAEKTISNILEGTTRTLSAKLTTDELFHGREAFKNNVVKGVEEELAEIGLEIISANIQEMSDSDKDNLYFSHLKKRATETASNQSRIDVAQAVMEGEIGVAEREGKTRMQKAAIERDAKMAENERNQAIAKSNAELEVIEAEADRQSNQARVEAEIEVDKRRAILEKELEEKRQERELASERAATLAPTVVNKERIETNAQADLYKNQRHADAIAYEVEKKADAQLYRATKEAEGIIALGKAEAERIRTRQNAHAEGLRSIFEASGNDSVLTQFYVGLNDGLPQKQAEEAAKAVQNMNPDMHIWTTGNDSNSNSPSSTITDLVRNLVPTMEAIDSKVKLPDYLPQLKKNASPDVRKAVEEVEKKLASPSTHSEDANVVKSNENTKLSL